MRYEDLVRLANGESRHPTFLKKTAPDDDDRLSDIR